PGRPLARFGGQVVVPREVQVEIAVLKGVVGAVVVSGAGRKALYREQRQVLARLASALWEQGAAALDTVFAADFAAASSEAARKRVIVDQVASLTDQVAIAWHQRLVGDVDPTTVGVWAPRSAAA